MTQFFSDKMDSIVPALIKVQSNIRPAIMDKKNPFFKSKYASLNSVQDSCKDLLAQNDLCVIQNTEQNNDSFVLVTTLMHSSGQWVKSVFPVGTISTTPQAMGSAITYARRYSLAAIVGIVSDEDDDAQEAQKAQIRHNEQHPAKVANINTSKINAEQVLILEQNIGSDAAYRNQLMDYLLKADGIKTLSDMPSHRYNQVLESAKKNLAMRFEVSA